jgi:hypothetical protein
MRPQSANLRGRVRVIGLRTSLEGDVTLQVACLAIPIVAPEVDRALPTEIGDRLREILSDCNA